MTVVFDNGPNCFEVFERSRYKQLHRKQANESSFQYAPVYVRDAGIVSHFSNKVNYAEIIFSA